MDIHKNSLLKKSILVFLIILIAACLRLYNLNFEDYWLDEQASFWVADPTLTINETLQRGKELDRGTSITYNILLKTFFSILNYSPSIGRYLPFIFGLISIPALCYLTFQIKKNESYLLVGVLSSINFYLISYSQEVRVYSLVFFISILSIILFFKLIDGEYETKKNYLYAFFYVLVSLFGTCLHIFFFIVIISQFSFLFLNLIFNKKKLFFSLFCILTIPILYLVFMYEYLILQIGIKDHWVQQVNIDFFYNFFFSRFFGSKIMGIIYLFILLYLVFINKTKILKFDNKNFLLVLIIFFSFFLPLTYGLIKQPILTDRYIIFVLVPVFILISTLILDIKPAKKKYLILLVILTSSLINNYLEIFNREKSKPEFSKSIEYISNSNIKNIFVKSDIHIIENITIHYAKNIKLKEKNNITFFKSKDDLTNLNNLWILCYKPINGFNCSLDNLLSESWKKKDIKDYNLINLTLYEKK